MARVVLREITKCDPIQWEEVRALRNQEGVRRFMYTDHIIGADEHAAWIERLARDDRQIVFVVFLGHKVSGVASINSLDRHHKRAEWAFYLDSDLRGILGVPLEFAIIDYAFDVLGVEKLNCEVIESNPAVVGMHLKFGFLEEGFRRSNIVKAGVRIGVHFLGLTKEEWRVRRLELTVLYGSVLDRFPLAIERESPA